MEAKKLKPNTDPVTTPVSQTASPSPRHLLSDRMEILRYTLPNLFKRTVAISQRGQLWLEILRREGIVGITEDEFIQVAENLEKDYFSRLEGKTNTNLSAEELGKPGLFVRDTNDQLFRDYGASALCEISFREPALAPFLFHSDLTGLCYNYYHRQPYYRNQPVLQRLEFQSGQNDQEAGAFHVDRLHQISFMLLVSDVTEKDTHMEYALRTHNRAMWKHGIGMNPEEAKLLAKRGEVLKCIGEKGMLYIFDASGIHRRCLIPGSARKILHCNVTTGHHLKEFVDRRGGWTGLANQPKHIRRMFDKLKP